MAVLQSHATYGSLFSGNTYTRTVAQTGLSAPAAGQGVIVFAQSNQIRTITSVELGSSGTPTALTLIGSVGNDVHIFAGTATGSEANADIVVVASGSIGDNTAFGVLVVDEWQSDQSGAVVDTMNSGGAGSGPWTWSISPVTPPTPTNLVVVAVGRGNRTFTEDADFTEVDTGSNLNWFGYIEQAAATAQGYDLSASDNNTNADAVLVAFAGAASGGGDEELTWLPRQTVATGRGPRMVASGMTPPGRAS